MEKFNLKIKASKIISDYQNYLAYLDFFFDRIRQMDHLEFF